MTQLTLDFDGDRCVFCGEPAFIELLEYWPETREFELDSCCQGQLESWAEDMAEWSPEDWQRFFWERGGINIRSVGGRPSDREKLGIHPGDVFTVDQGITIVRGGTIAERLAGMLPKGALSLNECREYVRQYHEHAPRPPAGAYWWYGVYNGPPSDPVYDGRPRFSSVATGSRPLNLQRWPRTLLGVALVGKVVARKTYELAAARGARIAEVTRVAFNRNVPRFLTYKASSAVYDQAARDACAQGFEKIQTFVLGDESGMSLRYTHPRWKRVAQSRGGQMDRATRRRAIRPEDLAQEKYRWELNCSRGAV